MPNFLECHIIQSVPVSCLNRDDTNSVKTVDIGGAGRTRISSQCCKRAIRMEMKNQGVRIGTRSRVLVASLLEKLDARHPDIPSTVHQPCAEAFFTALGADNVLTILSEAELDAAVDLIAKAGFEPKKVKVLVPSFATKLSKVRGGHDGLDIAAFGRMMASRKDLSVEAAVSVAHAYTTHRTSTGIDYFSAIDDLDEENPAGHIGTNEFSAGVFYRYISIDLDLLKRNLGIEETADLQSAVSTLMRALFFAVPQARQKTMTAQRLWDYAHILVRSGQPLQCLFDKPVVARGNSGLIDPSIEALEADIARLRRLVGNAYGLRYETVFGRDGRSVDDMIAELTANL